MILNYCRVMAEAIGDSQAVISAIGGAGLLFSGATAVDEQGAINLVDAAKVSAGNAEIHLVCFHQHHPHLLIIVFIHQFLLPYVLGADGVQVLTRACMPGMCADHLICMRTVFHHAACRAHQHDLW